MHIPLLEIVFVSTECNSNIMVRHDMIPTEGYVPLTILFCILLSRSRTDLQQTLCDGQDARCDVHIAQALKAFHGLQHCLV